MDNQVSSQFIASLIKSIQVVCHGNVEFNHNIEIVGHIYLHVDKCHKFNYVLNEEVLKDFDSTKFVSNSFPAEPPSKEPERKRRKNATPSSTTESDGATEIITIGNDADELSSKSTHPPSVSTASPTIIVPSTASTSGRQRSRRSSFPANQSALPSSLESERTPPPRHTTTSSQSQTLTQPQAKGQGCGSVSLSSELKLEVSRQSCTSVPYSSSVRDSYASSNPSSGSANSAATTSSTVEPDVQIKLEVPSEEEVQLLSHDMVGHVGSSHATQPSDPSTSSPGSAPLYPVMLHQNLAASHSRDSGGPSGSRMKRSHMESDIPALSSTYTVGQNEFTMHGSTMSSSSSKSPGSQWNQPSQRMMQEPPNDGLAEPMVHFDTNILGPRLSGGPTSTVTSMAQESNPGSLEGGDAQRLADRFRDLPLPEFSPRMRVLLEEGQVWRSYDKFVEECAYFVLAHGDMRHPHQYAHFGQRLFLAYPCMGSNKGKMPWSNFVQKLSQKLRHIRCSRNKLRKEMAPLQQESALPFPPPPPPAEPPDTQSY